MEETAWESLYNKKVWVQSKPNGQYWPSIVLNPTKHLNVHEKIVSKALFFVGKKYLIRFLGMPDSSAYGFASKSQITLYVGEGDPRFNQKAIIRYGKFYDLGVKLIKRNVIITNDSFAESAYQDTNDSSAHDDSTDFDNLAPLDMEVNVNAKLSSPAISSDPKKKRGRKRKEHMGTLEPPSAISHSLLSEAVVFESGPNTNENVRPEEVVKRKVGRPKVQRAVDTGGVDITGIVHGRPSISMDIGQRRQMRFKQTEVIASETSVTTASLGPGDVANEGEDGDDGGVVRKGKRKATRMKVPRELPNGDSYESFNDEKAIMSAASVQGGELKGSKEVKEELFEDSSEFADLPKTGQLSHWIKMLAVISAKTAVSRKDESNALKGFEKIGLMDLTLDEITSALSESGKAFGLLKNHSNPKISSAAKRLVKSWKQQHSEAISKIQSENNADVIPVGVDTNSVDINSPNVRKISSQTQVSSSNEALVKKMCSSTALSDGSETLPPFDTLSLPTTDTTHALTASTTKHKSLSTLKLNPAKSVQHLPDIYNAELLPDDVKTDVFRRRAVKLLMSTSLPKLRVALKVEKCMYKLYLNKDKGDDKGAKELPENVGLSDKNYLHKYTAGITRLAFGLNEAHIEPLKQRLLLSGIDPTYQAISERDIHNLCCADLGKLESMAKT